MALPKDAQERKSTPICTGVLDYFPDALAEVARTSLAGNKQHLLGPLHWDKSKSTDEADALVRHLIERGTLDTDGIRHSAKVAWRALALLQRELDAEKLEREQGSPSSPSFGQEIPTPNSFGFSQSLDGTSRLVYSVQRKEGLEAKGLVLDNSVGGDTSESEYRKRLEAAGWLFSPACEFSDHFFRKFYANTLKKLEKENPNGRS